MAGLAFDQPATTDEAMGTALGRTERSSDSVTVEGELDATRYGGMLEPRALAASRSTLFVPSPKKVLRPTSCVSPYCAGRNADNGSAVRDVDGLSIDV